MRLSRRLRGARESISLWKENAKVVFHPDRYILHELVAARGARLRDGPGRCDCALSSAERRKSLFSYRRRSTRAEGPAVRSESRCSSGRIRQRNFTKVCRSREKTRCEIC